jgi:acid phosphatase
MSAAADTGNQRGLEGFVAVQPRAAFTDARNAEDRNMLTIWSRLFGVLAVTACLGAHAAPLAQYDHVVVVIMSVHSPDSIIGSASAPYINGVLVPAGARFSNASTLFAPQQPNYIALLAGDNLNVVDDACHAPNTTTDTLPRQLASAALSFAQFSEGLPAAGDTSCTSGFYTRAHNAVTYFSDLPASMNQPYSAFADALANAALPTVSFVVPNICDDMLGQAFGFDCPRIIADLVALGDTWLSNNLPPLLSSLASKNTLLIVTWDIGDLTLSSYSSLIPVILIGPRVKTGYTSAATITHLSVLRLIEDLYALPRLRGAAGATEISDVFDYDLIFSDNFE